MILLHGVTFCDSEALAFTCELKWRVHKLIDTMITLAVRKNYAHCQVKIGTTVR